MPRWGASAVGAAAAVLHGVLIGASSVQAMARTSGFMMGTTSGDLTFMSWSIPILPLLGIALLSALALAALTVLASRMPPATGQALRIGYAGGGIAVIATAFALAAGPRGFGLGPTGWIVQGGTNSAFHLCVLVALALPLAGRARAWYAQATRTEPADGQST